MIVQVPVTALRLPGIYPGAPGEESKDITPEQGDPVSFSVEGVVSALNGSIAEVEVRLINGERPDAPADATKDKKPAKADEAEPSLEDMETAAQAADEEDYT